MTDTIRIANCSGFYGDRLSAAREMVEDGPIDVLTGDYLAELTLMILLKDRLKDPSLGYARTFLRQLEEIAATCKARGIKIVVNAGGLNPAGLAETARALYRKLGIPAAVAHLEGDDLMPKLADLQAKGVPLTHLDQGTPLRDLAVPVLSANAYLGAWGIVAALERGADLVICPRVTDAALTLMKALLEAAGSSMADLLQVQVALVDSGANWEPMNEVYEKHVPAPRPVRSYFGSTGFQNKGQLLQIDAIAYVD